MHQPKTLMAPLSSSPGVRADSHKPVVTMDLTGMKSIGTYLAHKVSLNAISFQFLLL